MGQQKNVNSQTGPTSNYQPLHIPSAEDFPRIAVVFTKLQVIAGTIAAKLCPILPGFYVAHISEDWSFESLDNSPIGESLFILRFQLGFKGANKEVVQQLKALYAINGKIPPTDEILEVESPIK